MRGKLDVLALALGFIGLVGVATITGLPMWKVTAFIGANIIAARGLMCVSVLLAAVALLVSFCGTRRTRCFGDDAREKRVTLAVGGGLFLLSCLATLVPVSWTAHTIIQNFYDPVVIDARKHELGLALYIGWATAGLLLAAGAILIWRSTDARGQGQDMYHVQPVPYGQDDVELERKPSSNYSQSQYV
ncbi:hypothetical protein SKAU_G00085950 [Synaphobranchus kaupii]|uniref:Uncharacterized protein n=1 Tax=Synaphobranchus kaupii TaxID=118154 RepID=A0A9Q1J4X4_SYNKA|nr:hypothetical protein SKAU_G00085950 [Synaphobranchus kaupii]